MNMKKLFAVLMALVMVLSLAACGSDSKGSTGSKGGIVGSWEGTMDLTDAMSEMFAAMLGGEIDMRDISLKLTFKFGDNGMLTCKVDEKSAEKMAENMIDAVVTALVEMGAGEEAELRDAMESSIDVDEMIDGMTSSFDNLFYIYEDGYVYTSDDEDELKEDPEANSKETWKVELSGKTMKVKDITDADGNSMDETLPGLLPMTLKKK